MTGWQVTMAAIMRQVWDDNVEGSNLWVVTLYNTKPRLSPTVNVVFTFSKERSYCVMPLIRVCEIPHELECVAKPDGRPALQIIETSFLLFSTCGPKYTCNATFQLTSYCSGKISAIGQYKVALSVWSFVRDSYRNRGHTIRIEFLAIRTPVAPWRHQSRDNGNLVRCVSWDTSVRKSRLSGSKWLSYFSPFLDQSSPNLVDT